MTNKTSKGANKMIKKIKVISEKYPVLFSVLLQVIFITSLNISEIIINNISVAFDTTYTPKLIKEIIVAFIAIYLMYIIDKKVIYRSNTCISELKDFAMIPFAIFAVIIMSIVWNLIKQDTDLLPISHIVVFTLYILFVGIAEEFINRGCIINVLSKKYLNTNRGVYIVVFVSSLIFGLGHLNNITIGVTGVNLFYQVILTMSIGWVLSAIYLRTQNIWLLVVIHALYDFSNLIEVGLYGTKTIGDMILSYSYKDLVSIAVCLTITLYLIRKSKIDEIITIGREN